MNGRRIMRWLAGFLIAALIVMATVVFVNVYLQAQQPASASDAPLVFDTYAVPLSNGVWLSGDMLPLRAWYRVNTGDGLLILCAAEYTSDYRTVLVGPGASSECDRR